MSKVSHARLFTVNGYQVLAYLDHDEERDNLLILRLRLWCDEIGGPVQITPLIGGEGALSDETIDLWEKSTRDAFDGLTEDKVAKAMDDVGVFQMLAKIEAEGD